MLNFLWAGMLLLGIVYAAFAGTLPEVTEGCLNGGKEAVELCLSVAGVVAFWNGLMTIAKESGLVSLAARRVRPFLVWLMPGLKGQDEALDAISVNMAANVLGLGWAATPAGLQAMEALEKIEEKRRKRTVEMNAGKARKVADAVEGGCIAKNQDTIGVRTVGKCGTVKNFGSWLKGAVPVGVASNEMCTFLILNISSLQLIPVNVIAYRSQYGSVDPAAVVGPGIVATAVSTGVAVVFCKIMNRRRRA